MEFNQYIFNQGKVLHKNEVSCEIINQYKDILPKQIIELWKKFGFSGISKGLIWLTPPELYDFIKSDWERVNNVLALKDQLVYLVGRSSFGNLMFYIIEDEGDSYFAIVDILFNKFHIVGGTEINFFFKIWLNDKSFTEMYFSEKLFKECFDKLGPLKPDECYGFVPLPVLGGEKNIEYVQKIKFQEYLKICAQSLI